MATISLKFGGWGRSCAVAARTNASSSVSRSSSLWRRSNAIVELTFMSIAGPPHSEPPTWPGHTSHSGGSASSLSCSEWKIP